MSPIYTILTKWKGHNFAEYIEVDSEAQLNDRLQARSSNSESKTVIYTQDPEVIKEWIKDCPACRSDRLNV